MMNRPRTEIYNFGRLKRRYRPGMKGRCPVELRQFALARDKLVEAAGVEPASEKARRAKPTCVAGSVFSAAA